MAGKAVLNTIQLGDSATAANNFVVKSNGDGSGGVYRGNDGGTLTEVLGWVASGKRSAAFSAHPTGTSQSVSTGTTTKVTLNAEEADPESCFDTANYRFVAPVAGLYHFHGQITFSSAATIVVPSLYKNGSQAKIAPETNSSCYGNSVTATLQLAAGDYVEMYAYHNLGSTNTLHPSANRTWLCGHLLKAT